MALSCLLYFIIYNLAQRNLGGAIVFVLFAFIIYYSLSIRRAHDLGASGWTLWNPRANGYLFYTPGQKEENEYGKPPEPKVDIKALFGFSQNSQTKPNASFSEFPTSHNGKSTTQQESSRG